MIDITGYTLEKYSLFSGTYYYAPTSKAMFYYDDSGDNHYDIYTKTDSQLLNMIPENFLRCNSGYWSNPDNKYNGGIFSFLKNIYGDGSDAEVVSSNTLQGSRVLDGSTNAYDKLNTTPISLTSDGYKILQAIRNDRTETIGSSLYNKSSNTGFRKSGFTIVPHASNITYYKMEYNFHNSLQFKTDYTPPHRWISSLMIGYVLLKRATAAETNYFEYADSTSNYKNFNINTHRLITEAGVTVNKIYKDDFSGRYIIQIPASTTHEYALIPLYSTTLYGAGLSNSFSDINGAKTNLQTEQINYIMSGEYNFMRIY